MTSTSENSFESRSNLFQSGIICLVKNKLQSLTPRFKKIKFIHVLLIILILVVFFGLFKREIGVWKIKNLPTVKVRQIEISKNCKESVSNPEYWSKYNEIIDYCSSKYKFGDGLPVPLDTQAKLDEFNSNQANKKNCYKQEKNKLNIPSYIEQQVSCVEIKQEKWFWAFGRYWFKI